MAGEKSGGAGVALAIVIPLVLIGGGIAFYLISKREEGIPVGSPGVPYGPPPGGAGIGGLLDGVLGPGTGQAAGVVANAAGSAISTYGGRTVAAVGKESTSAFKPLKDVVSSDAAKLVYKQALTGGLYVPTKAVVKVGSGAKSAYRKVKGWL